MKLMNKGAKRSITGGTIFIYLCAAQLISFEIWNTRMIEYGPPPPIINLFVPLLMKGDIYYNFSTVIDYQQEENLPLDVRSETYHDKITGTSQVLPLLVCKANVIFS